jgi:type IV secretory pathway VirB2 component (pilin)
MMRRTDVYLSAGTLGLTLFAVIAVAATGNTGEFVAWAWERHHNVLSWYIRPLFFLPFCFFAYKRSLWGMTLTLLALATSMFWFPAPGESNAAVDEMLGAEREYLTGNWTTLKVLLALVVPGTFVALGLAFWKRSLVYGLAVINAAVLIKTGWTFVVSTEAGAMSHLPAAVAGLAVLNAVILYVRHRMRKRSSPKSPQQAGQHG